MGRGPQGPGPKQKGITTKHITTKGITTATKHNTAIKFEGNPNGLTWSAHPKMAAVFKSRCVVCWVLPVQWCWVC